MTKKQAKTILNKIDTVQDLRQDGEQWLIAISELRGMILVLIEEEK